MECSGPGRARTPSGPLVIGVFGRGRHDGSTRWQSGQPMLAFVGRHHRRKRGPSRLQPQQLAQRLLHGPVACLVQVRPCIPARAQEARATGTKRAALFVDLGFLAGGAGQGGALILTV